MKAFMFAAVLSLAISAFPAEDVKTILFVEKTSDVYLKGGKVF